MCRPRAAIDVTRRQNDKATLVFHRCNPIKDVKHLMMSLTDTDHIRLIGNLGDEERKIFEFATKELWPHGTKKHRKGHELELERIDGG